MLEKISKLLKTGQPNNIELAYELRSSAQISLWPLERGIKDLLYLAHTQPAIACDDLYLGQLCHLLHEVVALSIRNPQLQQIPEQLAFMPNLRILEIYQAPIQQLPDSLKELQQLKSLSIRDTAITEIPVSVLALKNLQTLTLDANPKLQNLPNFLDELPNFKSLRISHDLAPIVPKGDFEIVFL